MLQPADWLSIWITLKLAFVSTALLLLIGLPLAWWLARTKSRVRPVAEAIVALPLILPPSVLGFYLLVVLGPHGPVSGARLAFTFTGLVIGSIVYSLPFVVQPLRDAFIAVSDDLLDAAKTLGASRTDRLLYVALPLARQGLLTATVLGFAHTVGEFGVALMIGGAIPGQTRVASIAIYQHVEAGDYSHAHWVAGTLLAFSFTMLLIVHVVNRKTLVVHA
ncbi:molybdate ABC transporter permease subunit [soil metagenome]